MPVQFVGDAVGARELLLNAASPIVVIPVFNSYDDAVRCYDSVIVNTSSATSVLVVDDFGSDQRFFSLIEMTADKVAHQVVVLRHKSNLGFVRSCNEAFEITAGRDLVLMNSDVVVGRQWLDRLTEAALSSPLIATASTLTNHGSILSVPYRNQPVGKLPDDLVPAEAARRIAAASPRLRPSIPTAIGHCFYLRRPALELVGGFDESLSPGYGEEVDFSQRATAHGFRHICADDVFTFHRGGGSFSSHRDRSMLIEEHELLVQARYPWYKNAVRRAQDDPFSALAVSLGAASRALVGLSVGIDGFCLGPDRLGTQNVVIHTIEALAQEPGVSRLVVFVPPCRSSTVSRLQERWPEIDFVDVDPYAGQRRRLVDIVYRPYQLTDIHELDFLLHVADRLVINQLDTIAFENPAYFENDDLWLAYRNVTRLGSQVADGTVFLSESSRTDAQREGLVRSGTPSKVVHCGVDVGAEGFNEARPSGLEADARGFVLCIGATYLHKNRPFALETWAELRRRGWDGQIVLAGPNPPHGNSVTQEAAFALSHPELRGEIRTLGRVSEAEKRWLYQRAALLLYPSTTEGFGLVPFEAARHRVPTLATRHGGLDEVLPDDIPVLTGFDCNQAADDAWLLLHDSSSAEKLCDAILEQAEKYTWAHAATELVAFFEDVLRQPTSRVLSIEGEGFVPIGIGPRLQQNPRRVDGFDAIVRAVIARPGLKRVIAPNGSARQRAVRNGLSAIRRRLL